MIRVEKLQIGDVVGTTSLSALSAAIKARTWGWRSMFNQRRASHVATVVSEHSLNYFMEMLAKGIHETDINEYDHATPRQHIVFVGRHKAFARNVVLQVKYNQFMMELHARHVKYGYEDLANFILEEVHIRLHDKQETLICSELPRAGFAACNIATPSGWEKSCSPANWQCWPGIDNITAEIIR